MKSRINLLENIFSKKNVDAFLITSPRSVQYLCGYFFNFETGPSPFQLIPSALVVFSSHAAYLVIADNETGQLQHTDPGITIIPYASYTYDKPLDYLNQFTHCLHELLGSKEKHNLKIGIEPDSLPHSVSLSLGLKFPGIEYRDIAGEIVRLRLVKDSDEVSMIRAATHLCDIGQASVLKNARPGMTEIELFAIVRGDMESEAGKRIPMMADSVCGSRTGEGGGNPSDKIMNEGDLIISDLTPCLNGYWGDTCNTVVVGKPGPEQRDLFHKIKDTLELGIAAVKPGARAADIDRLMRKRLAPDEYGHHSGHGVGLAYHEEPRIVPYNHTELQPGMIIALEPGVYTQKYGVRLEHLVLVTRSGCEVISEFNHRFE